MDQKIKTFGDLLGSKKIFSDEKSYNFLIAYLYNNYKTLPLHIMLLITSAYVKCYDG